MPSPAGVVAHAWRGTLPTARLLRPDPDRVSAPTIPAIMLTLSALPTVLSFSFLPSSLLASA